MTRRALKDDWLDGYFVPAGTEIYNSPYLIQRNPALWDDPDRFDPSGDDSQASAAAVRRRGVAGVGGGVNLRAKRDLVMFPEVRTGPGPKPQPPAKT